MTLVVRSEPPLSFFKFILASTVKSQRLSVIAEGLSNDLKIKIDEFGEIDEAVRYGKPVRYFGKDFPIDKYLPNANKLIQQAVSSMAQSIGDGRSIDNIILTGGGAYIFKPAIEAVYPNHIITIPENHAFSNVRGFQLAGLAIVDESIVERAGGL